jgi:hypothetical protein
LHDKRARALFKDGLGYFWNGRTGKYADNEREVELIADAIALASGAKRAKQIRLVRKGLTTGDQRRAQRLNETERRKQARAERKAAVEAAAAAEAAVVSYVAPALSPQDAPPPDMKRMVFCALALFLLVLALKACRREIEAAVRMTIRRATPQTADYVFMDVLRQKLENRLNRREADKLRKRRARRLAIGVAT